MVDESFQEVKTIVCSSKPVYACPPRGHIQIDSGSLIQALTKVYEKLAGAHFNARDSLSFTASFFSGCLVFQENHRQPYCLTNRQCDEMH